MCCVTTVWGCVGARAEAARSDAVVPGHPLAPLASNLSPPRPLLIHCCPVTARTSESNRLHLTPRVAAHIVLGAVVPTEQCAPSSVTSLTIRVVIRNNTRSARHSLHWVWPLVQPSARAPVEPVAALIVAQVSGLESPHTTVGPHFSDHVALPSRVAHAQVVACPAAAATHHVGCGTGAFRRKLEEFRGRVPGVLSK